MTDSVVGQAAAGAEDAGDDIRFAHQLHAAHRRPQVAAVGEHREGVHLTRGQPHVGEDVGDRLAERDESVEAVGHIVVALEHPGAGTFASHLHVAPTLRVDDEHSGRPDDEEVDLGLAAARPLAIGEHVESLVAQRAERLFQATLAHGGGVVVRHHALVVVGAATQLLGEALSRIRLECRR
jgi:hypothetical protein